MRGTVLLLEIVPSYYLLEAPFVDRETLNIDAVQDTIQLNEG